MATKAKWGRGLCAAVLACNLAASTALAQGQTAGACFARTDNRALPFDMVQMGAPPPYSPVLRDYAPNYALYPGTDYATATMRVIRNPSPPSASGLRFRKYYLLWVNRCIQLPGLTRGPSACRNPRPKGNGYYSIMKDAYGAQIRAAFSSYAKADACTLIQARRVLGETAPGGLEASARRAGLTLWDGYDRVGLRALARQVPGPDGRPATYLVDTCILEAYPEAPDAAGIMLDYEVWDNRSPAQAVAIIRQLADLAHQHGKRVLLTTNPLPKPPDGLVAENARQVLDLLDGFSASVFTGATRGDREALLRAHGRISAPMAVFRTQLDTLSGGGRFPLDAAARRKVLFNISLYDLSLGEARELHDEIARQGFGGIQIFRNYLRQGGPCSRPVNQTIACLAFGRCDGQFGLDRR